MFLSTLKEIIVSKPECLSNHLQVLIPLYIQQSCSDDEPIRNIVSESMGRLFVVHSWGIKEPLKAALTSTNAKTVATCARSFKFSAHNNKTSTIFEPFIPMLTKMVNSKDLGI
mmetsp:Transcript_38943/g.59196  ORF Transcript_38943/g.59196 Transcript_38943/m.59196 type:complete len:113 (+) Transcript_38943:2828-3166(+)